MKADLHVHSTYSEDGKQTVPEILERCHLLGFGALAITDHNAIGSWEEAARENKYGIILIRGVEVSTSEGHLLALGVSGPVPNGMGVQETIDHVHRDGGIAVAAHPYRAWSGLGAENVRGKTFDAVEAINGRSLRWSNAGAIRLAKEMGVGETGGSDAHHQVSLGRAFTILPDDCATESDVLKAIVERRTSAAGRHRSFFGFLYFGVKSVLKWTGRGFKRI
jgi:predicted metal-dependent phosphoesterase TrpH